MNQTKTPAKPKTTPPTKTTKINTLGLLELWIFLHVYGRIVQTGGEGHVSC